MQDRYPLHSNVLKGQPTDVLLVLNDGVDINQLDDHGNSPLHWAVLIGDDEMVKILLEVGANANVVSSDGITPTWSAVDFGLNEIEDLLRSYGGKIHTDSQFDRQSWSVFKEALGQPLPKEEDLDE